MRFAILVLLVAGCGSTNPERRSPFQPSEITVFASHGRTEGLGGAGRTGFGPTLVSFDEESETNTIGVAVTWPWGPDPAALAIARLERALTRDRNFQRDTADKPAPVSVVVQPWSPGDIGPAPAPVVHAHNPEDDEHPPHDDDLMHAVLKLLGVLTVLAGTVVAWFQRHHVPVVRRFTKRGRERRASLEVDDDDACG